MNENRKYITTPIYYVNGNPHVGHAHTSVMADILKRDLEMSGNNVFLTTGVDEHGQKNQGAIEKSGLSAKCYLDKQSGIFQDLFDKLDVKYDLFVRTTRPEHVEAVTYVLQHAFDKGYLVNKEYEGLYCEGCEMFKTDSDLDENGFCVDHQIKPKLMKESNYFFTLSVFQDWLVKFLESHDSWIIPGQYRGEILNMLKEPLPDLCISRPKQRVWHGIELPFDKDYVAYVWFDALINYISNIGYPGTMDLPLWEGCNHLMAKDIIKTHCIYWPIMLKALDLPLPARCLVHGYWIGEGGVKMSKSIGNVIDPFEMIDVFDVDAFRFFLAKNMRKNESQISRNLILGCYNADLANNVSNVFYRIMTLANRSFDGLIPQGIQFNDCDNRFLDEITKLVTEFQKEDITLDHIYNRANLVTEIGRRLNVFFSESAPWVLQKKEDKNDFNSNIVTALEAVRLLFETAYPIMPEVSTRALQALGLNDTLNDYAVERRRISGGSHISDGFIAFLRKE